MKVKQFEDKYDKEFVKLMLEVDRRSENFSKSDRLKISSWVNSLCLPTRSTQWKKNRNLYSIMLLDNIVNNRLEQPFNKFCTGELEVLNPTVVKSKISRKFVEEVNFDNANEEIQNFINVHYSDENDKTADKEIEERLKVDYINIDKKGKIKKKAKPVKEKNVIKVKKEEEEKRNFDIVNQMMMDMKIGNVNKKGNSGSDALLKKNYFGLKKKLGNEKGFMTKTEPKTNKLEQFKLESMVKFLQNEIVIKDQIITQQQKDLNALQKKVSSMERKVSTVFGTKI